MQVILKKDIPQLGRIGEIVKVREGYARNFLVPRQMAVIANPANARNLAHHQKLVDLHKKKVQKESEGVAGTLKKVKLALKGRLNESGKFFGSIGAAEIAQELVTHNFTVDRRDVEVESIKTPGSYAAKVRLPGDVFVEISVEVEGIEDKKAAAAAGKKTKKAGGKKAAAKTDATAADTSTDEVATEDSSEEEG